MCDDFYDDFDGDFDGEAEDYGDDWFEDSGPEENVDPDSEAWEIPWDGLHWQDWTIIGPLSEEIAREEREKDRIRRESEKDPKKLEFENG